MVGIVLFHGVEELDFAAPYAVFAAMRRLQIQTGDPELPETHVLAITRTPGIVHGASDRWAAYPSRDPVSPDDLGATILHALGIDPATEMRDPCRRALKIID